MNAYIVFLICIIALDLMLFLYFKVKSIRLLRLMRKYCEDAKRQIIEDERKYALSAASK